MLPHTPVVQKSAGDSSPTAVAFPEVHVDAGSDLGDILPSGSYAQQQILAVAVLGIDIPSSQTALKSRTQLLPLAFTVLPVFRRVSVRVQNGAQDQAKARSTPP